MTEALPRKTRSLHGVSRPRQMDGTYVHLHGSVLPLLSCAVHLHRCAVRLRGWTARLHRWVVPVPEILAAEIPEILAGQMTKKTRSGTAGEDDREICSRSGRRVGRGEVPVRV